MQEKDKPGANAAEEPPRKKKPYVTPELKQLGTLEDLTRWESSIMVGG